MDGNKTNFLKSAWKAKEMGILLILVLLSVLIQMKNPIFFTFSNLMDIGRNTSYTLIIAIGMTFVLIAKGLDLSVGSLLAICGLISALAMQRGIPVIIAVLLGLAAGAALGLFNALCIVRLKIPAMIATLGTMYMARGLVLVITKGQAVYPLPDSFSEFGKGSLMGIPNVVLLAPGCYCAYRSDKDDLRKESICHRWKCGDSRVCGHSCGGNYGKRLCAQRRDGGTFRYYDSGEDGIRSAERGRRDRDDGYYGGDHWRNKSQRRCRHHAGHRSGCTFNECFIQWYEFSGGICLLAEVCNGTDHHCCSGIGPVSAQQTQRLMAEA